uniref:Rieske domain-containing protein n=1 Tax=Tetradesmus obliquus TaxID=3088 RepID=A0A383VN49_TETOB|eukprot:jgi/Sobl393_1/11527/SZX66945.1
MQKLPQRSALTHHKIALNLIVAGVSPARQLLRGGRFAHGHHQQQHVASSVSTGVLQAETQGQEAAPVAAAAAAPAAAAAADDFGDFKWTEHWYPVHTLESADPARPHAVELLGRQLVLWRDGQGQWQCMEDACPHRLAPLSEGRIEADGTLQCSYHGWRFDSSGRCTEIPQAIDAKAKAVACSSSRSCVTRYPTRTEAGLIWVWPTPGPEAESAAAAQPVSISKAAAAKFAEGGAGTWYRRELPYSWDVLVENLTDPSHLPFSHHNLTPTLKRSKGEAPMPFTPLHIPKGDSAEDVEARPSFTMAHKAPLATFDFPSAMAPGGRVCFTPPLSVNYQYDIAPGIHMQNDLIAVPAGPGRSVAYTFGVSNAAKVHKADIFKALFTKPKMVPLLLLRYSFQNSPRYKSHLQMNKLFDQDSVFLNMQDRQLALRGKASWVQDYYMPAPCDGLVIAGRRWAEKALQLPLRSSNSSAEQPAAAFISLSAEAAAAPRLPQQQLLNRYRQHTQHCVICQKALQELKQKLAAAKTASSLLLAALVGVLAGVVVPGLLQLAAAQAAAGGAAAAAAGSVGLVVGVVVAGVMGAAAWLAKKAAAAAEQEIAQFEYVEFSHADNH